MSIKHPIGLAGVCFSLSALAPAPALAGNYQRGHLLYNNHCQVCHTKTVHSGKKREVKTLSQLRERVAGWASHAGDDWGKAEIDDVVHYLNRRYYHLAR
jgi:mono/diheme cytochrome c family protein